MISVLAASVAIGAVPRAAASVVTPALGIVKPDGALFTPSASYPPLGPLNAPIVGWAPRPGGGVWEVATDGGVFSRSAPFLGSMGGRHLNLPIVGMAATPSGAGYWLVASDGGIFTFGDAGFYGSTGAMRLNQPIVGMTTTPSGAGYWLVASDGGIFTFGDARFYGSTGAIRLNQPIVSMTATSNGAGYWLVASDGGIFTFGNAPFYGSVVGRASATTVSIAPVGAGYDVVLVDGSIWQFGAGNPGTQLAPLPITSGYQPSLTAQKAVAVALAQLGKPYVNGGSGPAGFDCSGLTQFAYAAAGIALPRTAAQQFAAVRQVALADAQPGDLLFFYPGITHVGIYLGNGLMVDAAHVGTNVQVEVFSPWFGPVMGVGRPGGP